MTGVADQDLAGVDEEASVVAWRAHVLVRAGYPADVAFALAEDPAVDVHVAVYLLEAGCDVDLALRIVT